MERALAHVEIVNKVESCPNADKLDLIHILGWQCVAAKGEFKEGDKCVYFEIDSRVDFSRPGLEFMEKRDGKVKTIKLRGNLSQGLAVGFDKLQLDADKYKVGQDVTKELGVTKILTQEEKHDFILDEGMYCTYTYSGEYDRTNQLFYKMKDWIQEHNYKIEGPFLEFLLIDIHETKKVEEYITSIHVKVKPR